jgi:hypothetical protein
MPVNRSPNWWRWRKSKPGELNWAGVTGALDFNFAGWLKVAELDMKKVPYRNPVEAANDLATNRVQVYESAVAIAQPQLQAATSSSWRWSTPRERRVIRTSRRWRRPASRR